MKDMRAILTAAGLLAAIAMTAAAVFLLVPRCSFESQSISLGHMILAGCKP